ncbi:MAG: hypothetical protein AAFP90_12930, partial [Planctomycetota bacterium]
MFYLTTPTEKVRASWLFRLLAVLIAVVMGRCCVAQSVPAVARRQTDQRQQDLLRHLIARGRTTDALDAARYWFQEAADEWLRLSASGEPTNSAVVNRAAEEYIAAAIRFSGVVSAGQLRDGKIDAAAIQAAKQPLLAVIQRSADAEDPKDPFRARQPWLAFAGIQVDLAVLTTRSIMVGAGYQASPIESGGELAASFRELDGRIKRLQGLVDTQINELRSKRTPQSDALAADLAFLQQDLALSRVRAAYRRSQIFPIGSEQSIALSARAAAQASDLMVQFSETDDRKQ